jgi:flagellar P-ring protein precursor FlgI
MFAGFIMRHLIAALVAVFVLVGAADPASARSRIKDIVDFEGDRTNSLVGYGLVMGLNGTGDNLRNSPQTQQSLVSMYERLGVNVRDMNLNAKNVASVMVTAQLPAFAAPGSRMDVTVSAIGDAKSLLGGTLVVTPLLGADGEAYAVAQGTVQTGGFSASGSSGSSVTRGVPTAGRIANGASVEREVAFSMNMMDFQRLTLRNPDFTTASRIAAVINASYPGSAIAENATVVAIKPPAGMRINEFATAIENLQVEPDNAAKVVIDEVNGVIVVGEAVRVSTVAIQQGNLTIAVQETPAVSQPAPFAREGETVVVPQSNVTVEEETGRQFVIVDNGASLATLVAGLNALGVTPRDMIAILQTLKAQGALQAEIEVL